MVGSAGVGLQTSTTGSSSVNEPTVMATGFSFRLLVSGRVIQFTIYEQNLTETQNGRVGGGVEGF